MPIIEVDEPPEPPLHPAEEIYGIVDSPAGGMDTYACMRAAAERQVDAAFMLGGNLHGANPDARWAEKATEAGDAQVKYELATLYADRDLYIGEEVEKIASYRVAAARGFASGGSQHELALMNTSRSMHCPITMLVNTRPRINLIGHFENEYPPLWRVWIVTHCCFGRHNQILRNLIDDR